MMACSLRVRVRSIACGMALAGLSGCAYDLYLPPEKVASKPAVASFQESQRLPAKVVVEVPKDPAPYYSNLAYQLITVRPGDTLSSIAARHETPVSSVVALNQTEPPYVIQVGQQLKVPYFKIHRVRAGETLYAIAKVYGVSMGEIVHFNTLKTPFTLRPATTLKIPQKGGGELRVASVDAKTWPVTRAAPRIDTEQVVVSRPKSTKSNKDLAVEKLPAPTPAKKSKWAAPDKVTSPVGPIASVPPAPAKVALGGTAIAKADLPPVPRERYSIKHPPTRSGKAFTWPVRGKLLSGYGKKKNGLRNDGINIAVKPGTAVKAAENGVVSYVGNEMRSFGNLILISHADGYVTTYGHTSEILVRKGDIVRRGDIIARAGATGDVRVAQLHFEIRKKGTALNPSALLVDR